jgi:hypothetical protein
MELRWKELKYGYRLSKDDSLTIPYPVKMSKEFGKGFGMVV